VLVDLDQPTIAADFAESVWREVQASVAPAVRCWTSAAAAEMLAGAGRSHDALRMISSAEAEAGSLGDERPPYLVFDRTHLDRWIGHTLVQLGDASGEERLRGAAADMDPSFIRASASLSLDLATAVLLRDEREEGNALLLQGEALARKVGSLRQLSRAQKLRAAL
jgi:hypothetical protein